MPITGTVLPLKVVENHRKDFTKYQVGEMVLARCPRFGIVESVIGLISGMI